MKAGMKQVAALVATVLAGAATSSAFAGGGGDDGTGREAPVAAATNAFAADFYGHLASSESGNIFYSPLSIQAGMAMTYAGARGATAREMATSLQLDRIRGDVGEAFGSYLRQVEATSFGDTTRLEIANRLWGQEGHDFLPSFLDVTRDQFGAELQRLDFARDEEGSRQTINTWVSERTQGRIPELLAPNFVSADTALVLTNAIYFKGRWASVFDPEATTLGFFRKLDGQQIDTGMMRQTSTFKYAEAPGVQVLEMPYEGGRLAMDVILPGFDVDFTAFEQGLTEAKVARWLGMLEAQRVIVAMPRWRAETEINLKEALAGIGVRQLFDPMTADLSGIDGTRTLFVSSAVHKAFVEVNEDGTEAAAATAVGISPTSLPAEPIFTANRPFVYLIRDLDTGTTLFMGRLAEPL
jgi:serpin B